MIEFSKVKKITIKEGVVKKITNSSGVVLWKAANDASGDTSSVTVDLNNQWVESTKKLDGYLVLMSNSNKGVGDGYASMKIKFKGKPDFKIWINSYSEDIYDYTIAFDMDVDYPRSNPSIYSTGVKLHTSGFQKDPSGGIANFKEVDYPNDGGEHFVVVTYRKNEWYPHNTYDDRGYVAIKGKLLSTSWVLSPNEFIKDSGKYYQRLNEVETYEGGITFLTGNHKKGDELTPTYIQSSDANDYILVGASMYYKKYVWVTPVDTAINTGDYMQGDYIGEATPSVKVTYTDDTEKTYYNLTAINKHNISSDKAKNIVIYDSIKSIDTGAFYVNTTLTAVTIPNSVTSIGNQAFDTCIALTSLELPNSITSVNYQTFANCSSLSSVTLPDSLTIIGERGFKDCPSLSSVKIPSGVTNIGKEAFRNCSGITAVTIENSTSKLAYNTNAFDGISSTAKLYVPSNLLADYQADTKWTGAFKGGIYAIPKNETVVTYTDGTTKKFDITGKLTNSSIENISGATKVEIGDPVTSIGFDAFSECINLSSVTIPNSVTEIGDNAFYYCEKLESLILPNSITSIGGSLCYGCSSLSSVTIPNSVTLINSYAFSDCRNLSSVTIPNSVTIISNNVFENSWSLTSVIIENSSEKISYSYNAFAGISSSAKLYVPSNLLSDYQADTDWTGAFPGGIYAIGS